MDGQPHRRSLKWPIVIAAVAAVAIAAGGLVAAIARSGGAGAGADAGSVEAQLSWIAPSLRSKMGLVVVDGRPAPPISLVDQRGRHVSLAALRGKPVVLDFMDSRCTDICPIVSREYVLAAKRLGARVDDVAFVAVNVNEYHRRVADVAQFSRAHRLSTLPNWHFLTGPTPALRRIWKDYGVYVEPNKSGDVVHSSLMYFIDKRGKMLYEATPPKDASAVPTWGRGIAAVSEHLIG